MPEFSLSLGLHLHHCGVGVLDVLQRFLNSRKQVNNLLLADQDLAVWGEGGERGRGEGQQTSGRHQSLQWRVRVLPEVCVQVFEDLVLVVDGLNDGLHHLSAVGARIRFRRWWRQKSRSSTLPSLIFVHIRLTRPYFCISSSVACRALWPFLLCNKNKYHCIYHTKNSLHRGDRTELLLFPNKVGLNYTATVPL